MTNDIRPPTAPVVVDRNDTDPHLPVLVRNLMSAPVVTVTPTAMVKDIAQILLDRDIRSVPVVAGDQVVGVVSEADLICREGCPSIRSHYFADLMNAAAIEHRHHWRARTKGLTAREIMTRDVITCTPDETVAVATRRMLDHELRILPVIEDGRLVGVLSRHDILRLFDRPDREVRERVDALLADPLWAPEEHHVRARVTHGVVTLTGWVQYSNEIEAVAAAIRGLPGVVQVINRVSAKRGGSRGVLPVAGR
jgi:CBS domain-containing protein